MEHKPFFGRIKSKMVLIVITAQMLDHKDTNKIQTKTQ